jgi:HAD superfamily hydrolase (TIGR01509 family)
MSAPWNPATAARARIADESVQRFPRHCRRARTPTTVVAGLSARDVDARTREGWRQPLIEAGSGTRSFVAKELPSNIKRYEDVSAAVETLSRSYVLAVATNGPADVQATKLRGARLQDFFPFVVASSEVGFGKPDPRIFQAAVERVGLPSKDVLVVGDSLEKDVVGSAAAGLRCVWVNRTDTPRIGAIPPAFEIRSLAELPDLITQIPAD